MKKIILISLLLGMPTLCFAGPQAGDKLALQNESVIKFRRGLAKIATSPLEIPKEIGIHWQEAKGPIEKPVYLFGGAVKGLANFVGRFGSGLWDTVSFNLNSPKDSGL